MPRLRFVYKYKLAEIHRAMVLRGLNQKTIARKIGKSEAFMSKFFRGENVSPDSASAIIRLCGLKLADMLIQQIDTTALKKTGTEARRQG